MQQTIWNVFLFVWPLVAGWLALKLLPSSVTRFVEKEIDRRSDAKLERIKGDIQGSYSTLKTSVDILMARNSAINPHVIEAVKALWATILNVKADFGGIITFDSVFLAEEMDEEFKKQDKSGRVLDFVRSTDAEAKHFALAKKHLEMEMDVHRLFCGDRLWLIFYVYRAIMGRFSLLITYSFEQSKYKDWRKDKPGQQLLEAVLPKADVAALFASQNAGLHNLFGRLEAEFLHEATRIMTGSKALAESLADTQALMQLENAKIGAK